MKKCTWVVENFVANNGYEDLISEIKKQGRECIAITYTPFQSGDFNKISDDNNCVIFQGSIQLAEQLQKEKPNWKPGVIADWRNYWCITWYAHMREHLFNQDYCCMTIGELIEEKWDMYGRFGKDATIWVRPDSGKKPFTAQLVELENFDKFIERNLKSFDLTEQIVVSSPKKIKAEFRFICSGNDIISTSCYQYQDCFVYIPSAPVKATEKCKEVLIQLHKEMPMNFPDVFFATDIWEDYDGKFYLGEFNAFSSCGLYKCNKESIVNAVSNYAESIS